MSVPVRSMTGFARVLKSTGEGEITVSLKSLNHRGLDLHFHSSPEIDPFENAMRSVIKRAVTRGHVDIRIGFLPTENGVTGLNETLLNQYVTAFRKAAEAHHLPNAIPDLNVALRMPGMFGSTG